MPIITIEGPPINDINKRRKLVADLTTSATEIYGMPKEKIIILIRENQPDQVAVAGELISDK
jgi:4-oxalocrotonate tautomerase